MTFSILNHWNCLCLRSACKFYLCANVRMRATMFYLCLNRNCVWVAHVCTHHQYLPAPSTTPLFVRRNRICIDWCVQSLQMDGQWIFPPVLPHRTTTDVHWLYNWKCIRSRTESEKCYLLGKCLHICDALRILYEKWQRGHLYLFHVCQSNAPENSFRSFSHLIVAYKSFSAQSFRSFENCAWNGW